MNSKFSKTFSQAGLTLVELLVAMVIGLFIVSGVVSVMTQGKDKFLLEQEFAIIQENARFAMDELAYEIRMAGYKSCDKEAPVANVLDLTGLTAANNWMYTGEAVRGFNKTDAAGSTALNSLTSGGAALVLEDDSDVLILNRAVPNDSSRVSEFTADSANATFKLTGSPSYDAGDVLMMVSPDCRQTSIFRLSDAGSEYKISTGEADGGGPKNCTASLKASCGETPEDYDFPAGSMIAEFRSTVYFIAKSNITGQPTLYRMVASNGASGQAQELLSGVEKMQVLYGTGSSASDVAMPIYGIGDADLAANWDNIVSLRVELTLVSEREVVEGEKLRKRVMISANMRNKG